MKNLFSKGKIDPVILGIIGFFVLLLLGSLIFLFSSAKENKTVTYSKSDAERPKLQIEKTNIDLGRIKVADKKISVIKLKNVGSKPLQITNVFTSCDCTSAQLVINGQESPVFSMHENPTWVGELQPNAEATLKAIYEPYKMPVHGAVERTIYFKTNDPDKTDVQIQMKANVN
ncbi:MAG: hypothetical protein A2172_00595 [Candidatus Woykebacteria bacterium RBG_13_40_15]|uniref:DUF1573 domain-containing protein n=1 Tax=Candidatus Woykebacteria bacterium RBG_13_40_15 TaxID=1802593 RepID=A0A1G1W9I3_9BACT|nr:MAG: hypothetical protein A2172_00595 [Candidatus Woykebacteria bacterium RBG_13_40_15]